MTEKADIVVCGPEGSGTRALSVNLRRLVEPLGKTVRHFSLPLGDWWWGPEDVAGEEVVVITRRPDCQSLTAWLQGAAHSQREAAHEWPQAIATLSSIRGAHWVLYEAMVTNGEQQLRNLCAELDVPFDLSLLEVGDKWWPWRDENEKYGAPTTRMRYDDITFACVVWNDADRLERLLEHVRPWFKTLAVVVQKSPDRTLEVARGWADIVEEDAHQGFGDASFGPKLQPRIKTKWTFKVDADEWPTDQLLEHLLTLTEMADSKKKRGVWVPFRSWVEDIEWEEQHAHLRLWHNSIRWPAMLHSRPMIGDTIQGLKAEEVGSIEHRRSLDEMMHDYLNYYRIGIHDQGWTKHNREMMRDATTEAAQREGWLAVMGRDWWPGVRDAAFGGKEKEMVVYAAGPSGSGTRMLFDMIGKLGLAPVHAACPGYDHGVSDEPIWWTVPELEAKYGPGKWVIIDRDPVFAAQAAVRRGFVKTVEDYPAHRQRALDILSETAKMNTYQLYYEQLVADPQGEFDKLADWLGVAHASPGDIFDGNQKYRDAGISAEPGPEPEPEPVPVTSRKPRARSAKRTSGR